MSNIFQRLIIGIVLFAFIFAFAAVFFSFPADFWTTVAVMLVLTILVIGGLIYIFKDWENS